MIAACPKCRTRYRIRPDQLEGDGLRLRCSRCSAVFRVRPPETRGQAGAPARAPAPQEPAPVSAAKPAERPAQGPTVTTESEAAPTGSPAEPRFDRERLVLVAHPEASACKELGDQLEARGLQVVVAHDGVEAILTVQRTLPRLVVLDAALPKMFGFQICELMKRNESLSSIPVVLVGALHKEGRYRRAPSELYGADAYVEPRQLPEALPNLLERFGVQDSAGPVVSEPAPPAPIPVEPQIEAPDPDPDPEPEPEFEFGSSSSSFTSLPPAPEPAIDRKPALPTLDRESPAGDFALDPSEPIELDMPEPSFEPAPPEPESAPQPEPAAEPPPAPGPPDPLADERARAERLARIIVSDIVLYNPEKFAAAVADDRVLEALKDELAEGRSLFADRIEARVCEERDYLAEELVRAAENRRSG